jgi:hypothetical protein
MAKKSRQNGRKTVITQLAGTRNEPEMRADLARRASSAATAHDSRPRGARTRAGARQHDIALHTW